jgi:hypothetical protein
MRPCLTIHLTAQYLEESVSLDQFTIPVLPSETLSYTTIRLAIIDSH